MRETTRRVWRAGPVTLVLVSLFAGAAGLVIPLLAYLIYRNEGSVWISALLAFLSVVALAYIWRFGLHPRVRATPRTLEVVNPFRRHVFDWNDITVIAPGENGLVVATEETEAEAWCIQKSNFAARRGHLTRADRIADALIDELERRDPPLEDEETHLRIRRARPSEARLLTRLERAASEDALAHIFPPETHRYPVTEVTRRWRRVLRDRLTRVYVLELRDDPVGYLAFDATTVRHLGVVATHTRRGYGSALLEFAAQEIFARGAPAASLWVLHDNTGARSFYRSHHWAETEDRRRSEFPPHPESLRMTLSNPTTPKRQR